MNHFCHWPSCKRQVPPKLWGCRAHWYSLPESLRKKIWRAYRPGQEIDKNPSQEYLVVANEAQDWIKKHEAAVEQDAQREMLGGDAMAFGLENIGNK